MQSWHFHYNYHAISHIEQTFFHSDVMNVIGESDNLENCPIVVAFLKTPGTF